MTELQRQKNKKIMERWANHGKIDIGCVFVLIDMVRNGEYPDGTFSDAEGKIWSEIMNVVEHYEYTWIRNGL